MWFHCNGKRICFKHFSFYLQCVLESLLITKVTQNSIILEFFNIQFSIVSIWLNQINWLNQTTNSPIIVYNYKSTLPTACLIEVCSIALYIEKSMAASLSTSGIYKNTLHNFKMQSIWNETYSVGWLFL